MKPIVFLGPSLAQSEAQELLDADYRPPAKANDVLRALGDNPAAIVIIDGLFEQVPSVRHKEILHALNEEVPVYGAASMGAIRAAELHPFGMLGVGAIYRCFASGEYEDDDEVAISHASADDGYRPLSEAMANIRHGLATAVEQGLIAEPTAQTLIDLAKSEFYPQRSWLGTLAAAAGLVPKEELERMRTFVKQSPPNQKALDAKEVLLRVRADRDNNLFERKFQFSLSRTKFLKQWIAEVDQERQLAQGLPTTEAAIVAGGDQN
jgi:hypothetical protein